ncbi:hypothetical protein [Bradyrhizobium sp. NP1]|uniref:hypothetical protein n=1 Tax=Bradyrhizobium sp. NP1 TaxID=3049772 RepID=UPI0025A55C26|nr:hypothetical protein [Bradyrhizobium sp. NP1]WJR79279.1 hypothetical protein QOU61_05690 [Bradyrhizobium sp. NP1]
MQSFLVSGGCSKAMRRHRRKPMLGAGARAEPSQFPVQLIDVVIMIRFKDRFKENIALGAIIEIRTP